MTSVYYGTENPEPGRSEQLAQWEEELLLGGVMLPSGRRFLLAMLRQPSKLAPISQPYLQLWQR